MTLSYKYALKLNENQKKHLDNLIFVYNQAYNASLDLIQTVGKKMYSEGVKSNEIFKNLYSRLSIAMKNRGLFFNSALVQDALRDAYTVLFGNIKQNKSFNLHFKKSSSFEGSFPLRKSFKIIDDKIRIFGRKELRFRKSREILDGFRITGYRIKREMDKYFLIVNITDDKTETPKYESPIVGMDTNSGNLTFSNGFTLDFLKSIYPNLEKKRINAQKKLSSKKKGSKNRLKARKNLFKVSRKIKNRRKDEIHKRVNDVIKNVNFGTLIIEDLNLKKMTKKGNENKTLRKNLLHQGISIFFNVLTYKCHAFGRSVYRVNPAHTSMTCSNCGNIKKIPLTERVYRCFECGLEIDRDLNASINIKNRGIREIYPVEAGSS